MVNVNKIKKELCCGCGACKDACTINCISMKQDNEGFVYPVVDEKRCLNCGKCTVVCPNFQRFAKVKENYTASFYASYGKNFQKVKEGSSGGIFELLAEEIIGIKGIVYGAYLDEKIRVRHGRATNIDEVMKFRKSKYLQSDMTGIFNRIKEDLDEDKNVLFTGTPCQVAALYSFVGRDYSNLFTVDIVCHGVPSELVFEKYICSVEEKNGKKIISLCWRNKEEGWGPNRISLYFDDGSSIVMKSQENPMQVGFLDNLYLRPSCYNCNFAKMPRIGDITLGDFWGYDGTLLKENNNKGLSLVVLSSQKGESLYERIREKVIDEKVEQQYCVDRSYHLANAPKNNNMRENFFRDIRDGMDFSSLCRKYIYSNKVWQEDKSLDLTGFLKVLTQ